MAKSRDISGRYWGGRELLASVGGVVRVLDTLRCMGQAPQQSIAAHFPHGALIVLRLNRAKS